MKWETAIAIASIAVLSACDGKGMHAGKIHKTGGKGAVIRQGVFNMCGDLTETVGGVSSPPPAPQVPPPPRTNRNRTRRRVAAVLSRAGQCLSVAKILKCLDSQKGLISVSTFNLDLGEPDQEGSHFRPIENDALKAKMLLKDHPDLFLNDYLDVSKAESLSQDRRLGFAFNDPSQTGCSEATLGNQTYTIDPTSTSETVLHLVATGQVPVRNIYYSIVGNSIRVTYYTQESENACDGTATRLTLRQSYMLGMGDAISDVPMAVSLAQFLAKHVNVSSQFNSEIPTGDHKQKGIRINTELKIAPKAYFYTVDQIEKGKVTGVSCQKTPPKQ